MARFAVKIPAIRFRREAVVETPPTRGELVKRALRDQQDRIAQRLTRRDDRATGRLDEATASTWASRFPGMQRLSRQNPEAARQLDEAAAASASSTGRRRYALWGLFGLLAAGAGAIAARRASRESRAQLVKRTGGYVLVVSRQTAGTARFVGDRARVGAAAARARIVRRREAEIEPETVTDRVQTELGEEQQLRHLPRINVNTEPGGVVYLRGTVPGEDERQLAEEIARRQRGVAEVVNELQVGHYDSAH